MLTNIIDNRKRPYRFLKVNAIVEATWHDNRVKDADQSMVDDGPSYAEKEHITVTEAVVWANSFQNPVTLYIYDEDQGIYAKVKTNLG
jgi:hypothetical protein